MKIGKHAGKAGAALLMAAALATSMAGCNKAKKPVAGPEAAKKPAVYKIGAILSVTGKASFLGDPQKKTLEMLEKELNAKGGIDGVPIKIIIEDDAGDEQKTTMAASKLIDRDNVLAIIGPSRTGNSLAIKDMMAAKKVPLISFASAEIITNPSNPYVFKDAPNDSFVAEQILMDMQAKGLTNLGMLYDNTSFGQEGFKQISAAANKYGVTVAIAEAYQPAATEADIQTLLTKIKANGKVQAVLNWSILPAQSIVPRVMNNLGMDKMVKYQSHGFANIKYVKDAGPAADGTLFPASRVLIADLLAKDNPQKTAVTTYKKMYEEAYKEELSTFGGHAWDGFHMIVKALEISGADREKLRDAIEQTSGLAGTAGVFNFSDKDHSGLTVDALEMIAVKDGKFVPATSVK